MTQEKQPILRSLLEMDSYLSLSASEREEIVSENRTDLDRNLNSMSRCLKQCRESWPFYYFYKKPASVRHDRIVDRNGDFFQSNGKMAIKKKIRGVDWRALYAGDIFHSLIDAPSSRSIGILLSGYMLLVVLFAIPYYHISKTYGCDMGIDSYQESFSFSLETMATIGESYVFILYNSTDSVLLY
jgi:hypothetical protein